tara:strand:- start:595 stop:900 length:306 start_codon:yes stop_codon:yes gene_type:complete
MIYGISIIFEYVPILVGWVTVCDLYFINEVYKYIAIICYVVYLLNKRSQLDTVAHNVSLSQTTGVYPERLNSQIRVVKLNFVVDICLCGIGYIVLIERFFF